MRLAMAMEAGAVLDGSACLINPPAQTDLAPFVGHEISILHHTMPDAELWTRRGHALCSRIAAQTAIVFIPRAKEAARDVICQAQSGAKRVVVDGAKTDGVDALLKEVKARCPLLGQVSKAHGKTFWFESPSPFGDWQARPREVAGFVIPPGTFSADGIDPGSRLLVECLPALSGLVADLGAGWGYLSDAALGRSKSIQELHAVEANAIALDAAQANVTDPRARFHWADARSITLPAPCDHVIMNPPFHSGRKAEPDLGQAFIQAAARLLRPGGGLWLVANRHLPYEATLKAHFTQTQDIGGNSRYKVLHATRGRPR